MSEAPPLVAAGGGSSRGIFHSLGRLLQRVSLKFLDRDLEREFQDERRERAIGSARSLIYGAIVFISVFIWQDNIISPDLGYLAICVRIYFAIPMSILALWATYRDWGRKNIDFILLFLIEIYTVSMVAVLLVFQGTNYGLTSSTGVSNILLMLFGFLV